MGIDADALIVGAGPAGAATAILLRLAGWQVILVEKREYPRQKVCGECLSAASLALLDSLGVGDKCRSWAGPNIEQVGWMNGASTVYAPLPPCAEGPYRYGRALGRDRLDMMVLNRAAELGAIVIQPGKVQSISGEAGNFECAIRGRPSGVSGPKGELMTRRVRVVIDAHGSWETGPETIDLPSRSAHRGSDLFGFKASFADATLSPGLLPVLSFEGGYGGLVIADEGRLTFAGCIRRDTLGHWRRPRPELSAGAAFEHYVLTSCRGVREALNGARRVGPWLATGPLRPHMRLGKSFRLFTVGNAAGETHPLIGEGMSMALQSAFLLSRRLGGQSPTQIDARRAREIHRSYQSDWRAAFAGQLRLAAIFAHLAMRPALSLPTTRLLLKSPPLLTSASRLAGKARQPFARFWMYGGAV